MKKYKGYMKKYKGYMKKYISRVKLRGKNAG